MSHEQFLTDNIKLPNNDMEVLRKHFSQCFDKDGKFQFEKFKQNLTEKDIAFSAESYGLDWLGKSYARLLASDPATTLLKPDTKHNQQQENINAENLLLKGDNLEVLKHLVGGYYQAIKMIYIDPPYNTGSDGFVYQDNRKFSISELSQLAGIDKEKAKRILDFTQSKSNSHSAWLTFMYPRLYIAKQLLKDDGVIFISIDDNEVAQLRLLMDEIFGEENFVAQAGWQKVYSPKNQAKHLSNDYEYVLIYSKLIKDFQIGLLPRTEEMNKRYSNADNDPRGPWKSGDLVAAGERKGGHYIIANPKTGKEYDVPEGKHWAYSESSMKQLMADNRISFGINGDSFPSSKQFLSEVKQGRVASSLFSYKEFGHTDEAKKDFIKLFGDEGRTIFETLKPLRLIKMLTKIAGANRSDLILDFFAGSGTTGDAVMQLNAEDGGSRRFILVQLPEAIDSKKNKVAFDFVSKELGVAEPTIFEITKERLLRAAKKINAELDEKNTALHEKKVQLQAQIQTEEVIAETEVLQKRVEQNAELKAQNAFKIFETMPLWDDYHFEAEELNSTQTLFDADRLTAEDIESLLTTWKTSDGIALTYTLQTVDIGGYSGSYGNNKLYMMNKGFTTDNLQALLEKIDADKHFNPTTIIIFGYHFESKNLREIAENVKSYANKKNIDIDVVTRY